MLVVCCLLFLACCLYLVRLFVRLFGVLVCCSCFLLFHVVSCCFSDVFIVCCLLIARSWLFFVVSRLSCIVVSCVLFVVDSCFRFLVCFVLLLFVLVYCLLLVVCCSELVICYCCWSLFDCCGFV